MNEEEALRQFKHNNGEGFVFGYDIPTIDRLLKHLRSEKHVLEQKVKNLGNGIDIAWAYKTSQT
jgi:hypothetical protein